jgi:hypothetical protein
MKRVKIHGSEAEIAFNRFFYTEDSIKTAIDDFSGVCNFSFEERNNEFVVVLKSNSDIVKISEEFLNYVLGVMKADKNVESNK